MPSKRDPSKQRRQARNRAEREARQARRDAAAAPPSRPPSPEPTPASDAAAEPRRAPARATAAPRRGRITEGPPGTRAAFLALLFAIGGALAFAFLQVPVDDAGDRYTGDALDDISERDDLQDERDDGELDEQGARRLAELEAQYGATTDSRAVVTAAPEQLLFVLPPVLVGAVGFRARRAPNREKTWMRLLIVMVVFTILVAALAMFYLPMVIALGVATFQARKEAALAAAADGRSEGRPRPAADDDHGGVIDVDGSDDGAIDDEER